VQTPLQQQQPSPFLSAVYYHPSPLYETTSGEPYPVDYQYKGDGSGNHYTLQECDEDGGGETGRSDDIDSEEMWLLCCGPIEPLSPPVPAPVDLTPQHRWLKTIGRRIRRMFLAIMHFLCR
jgi:hypothetical protein